MPDTTANAEMLHRLADKYIEASAAHDVSALAELHATGFVMHLAALLHLDGER
jgi:hypothetical protein